MTSRRWLLFPLLFTASCVGLVESDGERHQNPGSGGSAGATGATSSVGTAGTGVGQGGGPSTVTGSTSTVGTAGSGPGAGGSAGGPTTGGGGNAGTTGAGGSAGSAMTDGGAPDRTVPPSDAADVVRGPDAATSDARDASSVDAGSDRGTQDAGAADVPVVGDPESGLLLGITRFHNVVRSQVGIPGLTWDPTIAATAQAYAAKCVFQHSGTAGLGENLAAYAPPGGHTASAPVNDWASEGANYDYANNTCASGKVCGHYTQVVWKNSLRLGCGVQSCSTNSPFMGFPNWEIWVCNYSPPGNFVGQRPY